MYKIAKENLSALFQKVAETQELYLPVNNNGQVNFAAWTEGANVDLDTLKSVKSPKDAFFPQSENLYTVRKEDKKIKIDPEALKDQDFVVFGMKACDVVTKMTLTMEKSQTGIKYSKVQFAISRVLNPDEKKVMREFSESIKLTTRLQRVDETDNNVLD